MATAPARRGANLPAVTEPRPVKFVANEAATADSFGLPDGFEGATEAPSSLSPTAVWESPGEGMAGLYLGMQVDIGPNESRLYTFNLLEKDAAGRLVPTGQIVGVWGSTVLDRQMDMLNPVNGDAVAIVYDRDADKKPGQNPARVFRVAKKRLAA